MDETDTGWNDDILVHLSNEEPTNIPNWCEISLGSEEEQDLKGRLRFRKDSRSSDDMPHVTNQMGGSPASMQKSQELDSGSEVKSQESFAYHFGLMVVQKAANAVNNVADGGKKNRSVIRQLRVDLEYMTQKYEGLQKELENSKQWIAYYEKLKENMENHVVKINERFTTEFKSMQENLTKSETEAESCRRQVKNAVVVKKKMDAELEDARRTIEDLTFQVEEAQKQSSKPSTASCCKSMQVSMNKEIPLQIQFVDSSLNCKSTQATTVNNNASTCTPSLSSITDQTSSRTILQYKERQLHDATKALEIAHARGDKLRQQLVASASAMKSQTNQMKTCRAALEAALNESRDLKALLKEEIKKQKEVEYQLQKEVKQHHLTAAELEVQKCALYKVKADAVAKEGKLLQQNERLRIEATRNDQLLQESNINRVVEGLVSNAINAAYRTCLKTVHSKQVETLKDKSRKNAELSKLSNFTLSKLQNQVKVLEAQLKHKEADLEQYKSKIRTLMKEADNQKTFEAETEKREKNLQEAISASELKLSHVKVRLEKLLSKKSMEISLVSREIETLKNENLHLKSVIKQKRKVETFSMQTDLLGSDVTRMRKDIHAAEANAQELTCCLKTSEQENLKLQDEVFQLRSEIKQKEDQFYQTKNLNYDLQHALENERRNGYEKQCFLSQTENDFKKLNWTYQNQQSELLKLQRENAQLKRNSKISSICNSQEPNHTIFSEPVLFHPSTQLTNMVEHKRTVLPAHVFDQGDANESRRSSLSRLDTIPESDERSSISIDCKSGSLTNKESVFQTTGDIADKEQNTCSSTSSVSVVETHIFQQSSNDTPAECHQLTSAEKKRIHLSKKPVKKTSKDVEDVIPTLPIWRRERTMKCDLNDSSTASTSCSSQDEVGTKLTKETLQGSNEANALRQIGIPMSEEAFQRLLAGSPTCYYTHVELSQDDGYSSSSNSVFDELHQQCLIWESTELKASRNVQPLCNASQVSNVECSNLPKNSSDDEEDHHYFVTYAGVTFDLAEFSMARMREITASCEATSTAEGMNAFFDFLAHKVEELDQDAYWSNRHNLGRPDDWLSLKNCYL